MILCESPPALLLDYPVWARLTYHNRQPSACPQYPLCVIFKPSLAGPCPVVLLPAFLRCTKSPLHSHASWHHITSQQKLCCHRSPVHPETSHRIQLPVARRRDSCHDKRWRKQESSMLQVKVPIGTHCRLQQMLPSDLKQAVAKRIG